MPKHKQKLYCYVDESGQDTAGRLFLVAVVVVASQRDILRRKLEQIEKASGKGHKKWTKSTKKQRNAYIEQIISNMIFKNTICYSQHNDSKAYVDLTILSTAKAILDKAQHPYTTTVYVDGLRKNEKREFAAGLRKLHVKVRLARGINDQADEFIRLADAIAGFVRDSIEKEKNAVKLYKTAVKNGLIKKI